MTASLWDPEAELAALRWRPDMVVTTPFGERVWLKPCYDQLGRRIGITDCCPEDDPCERHLVVLKRH